jgi:hypothetical protein
MGKASVVLAGKVEEKKSLARLRFRWKGNVKMDRD